MSDDVRVRRAAGDAGDGSPRVHPYGPTAVLVIAKAPVPGRVKTRLTTRFTPSEAARLAEAALVDTLDAVAAAPARRRVLVLQGEPGPWLPPGFEVLPQRGAGLDERLAAAFADCGDGPAVVIGMDTPQLGTAPSPLGPVLGHAAWLEHDAWFGAAADGGFWALGLKAPDPALLRGVPMSVPETGAAQRARLDAAGLRVGELPPLWDVDTPQDAERVAAEAPASRFAALHRELTGAAGGPGRAGGAV